jgi:putative membrane protein
MMKFDQKKTTALVLSAGMLAGCLSGCGTQTEEDTTAQEAADQITETAVSLLKSHGAEEGKEETVYVVADANGTPTKTIVSAWLKNPDEDDQLVDYTDLDDIETLKGDQEYSTGSDGSLVWQADGSDIYYQGTTQQELPVDTTITYTLDGKQVSADELEGATGHLVMTFQYTNKTAQERTVDGKKVTLYQPFAVISGTMLDSEKAANVTVTNGKVINSGDSVVVVGMALPGLRESLGLDDLKDKDGKPVDVDVPESVTIEADVSNFSLLTTITVMDNSLLSELDLDNVDTFDDLKDSMDELTDASTQLVDGTGELYDGVTELSDGTDTLSQGVSDLKDGASALADGTGTLKDGVGQLSSGAVLLQAGMESYLAGESKINAGIRQLADETSGAPALAAGASQLSDGMDAVVSGGNQLIAGYTEGGAISGAAALADGAAQLNEQVQNATTITLTEDQQSTIQSAGYSGAAKYANDFATGVCQKISTSISDQKDGEDGIVAKAASQAAGSVGTVDVSSSASDLIGVIAVGLAVSDGKTAAEAPYYYDIAKGYVNSLATNVAQDTASKVGSAVAGSVVDQIAGSVAGETTTTAVSTGLSDSLGKLGAGIASQTASSVVSSVNTQLVQTYAVLGNATQALADGSAALNTGVNKLYAGTSSLVDGLGQLSQGADALESGTAALNSGVQSLAEGSNTLHSNNDSLTSGMASAASGAAQLASGVEQLDDGAKALYDGTTQLADGTGDLSDGVSQLLDGAKELMDGMTQFDEEGIQTLSDLFEDDGEMLMNRLRALQDYAGEYTSFTGSNEEYPSTVRFILRTESIGE